LPSLARSAFNFSRSSWYSELLRTKTSPREIVQPGHRRRRELPTTISDTFLTVGFEKSTVRSLSGVTIR
jgi:hypothetical protein